MILSILFAAALAFQGQGRTGADPSTGARADAPTTQPIVTQKFAPEYTQEALDARLQGTVTLSVIITPEGKASQISVVRSLGMGLDEKAIECVEKWRFRPGLRNGEPVSVRANIEINFLLPK